MADQLLVRDSERKDVCDWRNVPEVIADAIASRDEDFTRRQRSEIDDLVGDWADVNFKDRCEDALHELGALSSDDVKEKIEEYAKEEGLITQEQMDEQLREFRDEMRAEIAEQSGEGARPTIVMATSQQALALVRSALAEVFAAMTFEQRLAFLMTGILPVVKS